MSRALVGAVVVFSGAVVTAVVMDVVEVVIAPRPSIFVVICRAVVAWVVCRAVVIAVVADAEIVVVVSGVFGGTVFLGVDFFVVVVS